MAKLTPADPSFADTAPQIVVTTRELAASPEQVWEALIDTPGWADWFPNCKKAVDTSEPAGGLGSKRAITIGPATVNEEFIIWDPNVAWGFTLVDWPLPGLNKALEKVELADIGTADAQRTRATYTGAFDFGKVSALLWPLMKRNFDSSWAKAFENLSGRLSS